MFCEEEREFYLVKETPKQIKIEWIGKSSGDNVLDFNVRWHYLLVGKEKNRKHCLREFSGDYILIYPFQAGQPFSLETATAEHCNREIESCKSWGISSDYYEKIKTNIEK